MKSFKAITAILFLGAMLGVVAQAQDAQPDRWRTPVVDQATPDEAIAQDSPHLRVLPQAGNSAYSQDSRRAALAQWALPTSLPMTGRITLGVLEPGVQPELVASDGADLWVANHGTTAFPGTVTRVRASDGKVLGTWTGATNATGVLVARGRIYVTGNTIPGNLYSIDPSLPPGTVTTLSSSLGGNPTGIATDGTWIWTANFGSPGSISKVDPDTGATTNIQTGFSPIGILFDGTNIWVTDGTLKRLDANGNVIQSVPVGQSPQFPVFDGSNIWVPNHTSASVTVVRARDGMVLATLTGNGVYTPTQAAFDGQRILVTNINVGSLSLWKAADLTPIGSIPAPNTAPSSTAPFGACSDGINFWITLQGTNQLARF
jgi:hypothetical protein